MTILETRSFSWRHEEDCAAAAARLSQVAGLRQACLTLHGPLGAGKTTFTRHLLRALGVTGRIKSPSYAVLETHLLPPGPAGEPAGEAHHFDFYRFADPNEWVDAGLRETYTGDGLKICEWPEHAGGLLPPPTLALHLSAHEASEHARQVCGQAHDALGRALLAALAGS